MKLKNLVKRLDDYLQIDGIKDSCWNGLQFEGKKDVNKVILAVDAGIETFNKAAALNADIIIVHHGHFWDNINPSVVSWSKERLEILFRNKISLYACHLPLDRHSEVGNNAQILKMLNAKIVDEFLFHDGKNIGWIGELGKKTELSTVVNSLNKNLKTVCKVLAFGNSVVKKLAVCSGGGGYSGFYEALSKNVDLYITGDAIEVYYTAKDAKMNVVFAGHHATETIGLSALGDFLEKEFSLQCTFVDLPTGL